MPARKAKTSTPNETADDLLGEFRKSNRSVGIKGFLRKHPEHAEKFETIRKMYVTGEANATYAEACQIIKRRFGCDIHHSTFGKWIEEGRANG